MSGLIRLNPGANPRELLDRSQGSQSLGLSTQNEKIFNLVVGQIIPAIATGALIVCVFFSFTVTPLFIIGAVAAFVIGFLGVGATFNDKEVFKLIEPRPVFEPNQPVGISNGGNNCWANAALQLIVNNPHLEEFCRTDRAFGNIFDRYRNTQACQEYDSGDLGREVRDVLHVRNGNIDVGSGMEDPADFFLTMLSNIDQRGVRGRSFYQLQQSFNDGPWRDVNEPLIGFPIEEGAAFQDLFNSFFTCYTDEGQRMRKVFPTAPETLAVHLRRFEYELDQTGAVIGQRKKNNFLDIPFEMDLASNRFCDRIAARYECTGFIEHLGESIDGGHYISYVKRNGKWWLCNDSDVREVSTKQVEHAKGNSYIITYGRV